MSERTDGQRKMNGDGDPVTRGSLGDVHASDEQLNAYLDGVLTKAERADIERHVDACAACRTQLDELGAMTAMLRALPAPQLRRSFQLGPEYERSSDSIWSKLASWLLPTLPALRATTVAVALLLAAVSIRNIVDDPADRGVVSDVQPTMQSSVPTVTATEGASRNSTGLQTNQQTQAPTFQPAPDSQPEAQEPDGEEQESVAAEPTEQAFAADAPEPADSTLAESPDEPSESTNAGGGVGQASAKSADGGDTDSVAANETGDGDLEQETSLAPAGGDDESADMVTGADENIAMAAAAAAPASPTPAPSMTATPLPPTATSTATTTPSPSPTATPEPPTPQPTVTPSPVSVTASTQGDSIGGWEAIQLILAVALILLIALLFGLHRLRGGRGMIAR